MAPAPPAPEPRPTKQAPRPAPTMSAGSGRSQHRRRGPLLLGALALLLILLGLAAYSLFGGSADPNTASSPPQDEEQANAPAENGREDPQAAENADPPAESEQQPQGQEAQQGSAQQQEQAEQPQNPSAGGDQGGAGSDEPGRLTEEAAVQTIVDHYNVAASENYEDAWDFLSSRYQGEIGAQARWTNQFATLQRVEYTREPVATITGDTAEVSFSTRATHSDRTDFVDATAFLVQEDGRWKIDRLAA